MAAARHGARDVAWEEAVEAFRGACSEVAEDNGVGGRVRVVSPEDLDAAPPEMYVTERVLDDGDGLFTATAFEARLSDNREGGGHLVRTPRSS